MSFLSSTFVQASRALQRASLPELDALSGTSTLAQLQKGLAQLEQGAEPRPTPENALPFAGRTSLFEPRISLDRGQDEQAPVKQDLEVQLQGLDVQLLGFARVHAPKAILRIDGETYALGVGTSEAGLNIVDIAPPRVTVTGGGNSWTLSLLPDESRQLD